MDIGIYCKCKKGEIENGDDYLIKEIGDKLFIAVIDGLGHGPKASEAAITIKKAFNDQLSKGHLSLPLLFDIAHSRAGATRGGVVGAVLIDFKKEIMSYMGVGNITARLIGENENENFISTDGIVGYIMERKKAFEVKFQERGILVLHSDGISGRYGSGAIKRLAHLPAEEIAKEVVQSYGRNDRDDTTFIAVKF